MIYVALFFDNNDDLRAVQTFAHEIDARAAIEAGMDNPTWTTHEITGATLAIDMDTVAMLCACEVR